MVKKKKNKKGPKLSARQLQKAILRLLAEKPKAKLTHRYIKDQLQISNNRDSIGHALQVLAEAGQLSTTPQANPKPSRKRFEKSKAFSSPQVATKTYEGTVDMTRTGDAYIVCDDLEQDVRVPAKKLKLAMNGDRVLIELLPGRGRHRLNGKVKKVLRRAVEHFLGKFRLLRKYAVVVPEDRRIPFEIFVDPADTKEATDGDIVVVKVIKWPGRQKESPIGVITSVLGEPGGNDIEMNSILLSNGFDLGFTDEINAAAEALPAEIPAAEARRRRDMRSVTTFTIDPDTAKDFDDALSIEFRKNGECEIGVHIADVTHYVKEGTILDKEAYQRSTSVYLVDRVAPMLPERLSNELCSLRPHEDKCTFSAVFVFGRTGKIKSRWFGKTLTHSDRRFTYGEAQQVLDGGKGDFARELLKLNKIAHVLRKERFKQGAIAFESEEVKFRLDEEGNPIGVYVKERQDAHMLIEDFMLLANREVATLIDKKQADQAEIPFVYRVHDTPNPDKVADFVNFARNLGFSIRTDTPEQIAESYNRLAAAAREDEALRMLEPIAIRTMAKAIYTTDNIGHYGLGFDNYSHFTSPIRRYSDVLTHRLLEKNLRATYRTNKERLEEQCQHVSNQERRAMDAERESVKYKMVEYIQQFVGQSFTGYVSGIIDRGFFVELAESKAEGMVGFDSFDEAFEVEDGRLQARGRQSGRLIRVGASVTVRIVDTDLGRRQIEMVLAD
ncbi:MAG: ribonuclease R [Bacteroidota bacterium]